MNKQNSLKDNFKIIVVEDDSGLNKLIQKKLKNEGFNTVGLLSGNEALKSIDNSKNSLLLLDYKLPDMLADILIEKLKNRRIIIPFVIITGYGDEKLAVEMMKLGAIDYLTKDSNFLDLLPNVINRAYKELIIRKKLERTEKALEESIKTLNSIVNNVPDIIYRLDDRGRISFISSSVKKYGYEPEELVGMDVLDLVHPEDKEKAYSRINERRTGEESTKALELRILTKNRNSVDFEVSDVRIHEDSIFLISAEGLYTSDELDSKHFIGTQGIARDITERKKAEEEKNQLKDQLYQAQKMESIGRLAGGIAHDFNNVLASIMGFAEILKIKYNDVNTNEGKAVDIIFRNAERGAALTQQLLSFSRKGKFNPVPININEIINETIRIMEKIFEKKINIIYDLDEKLSILTADKTQIEQVLTNLIINAKDAMPKGGDLTLKTENVFIDENYSKVYPDFLSGNYVKVSVTDTGMGMPKDIVDYIFEPFFTTKGEGEGTGLGLATVYGIVKNHNGNVRCYSDPGVGTTFKVYFPVATDKKIVTDEIKSLKKGNGNIMIIDDENDIRDLSKMQLESLGYNVVTVDEGQKAIEIYNENKNAVHLVILDIVMPEMSGLETFEKLKKINPDLKVLLASGYSKNEMVEELLKKGANSFIQKPFKINQLSEIVFSLIQN